MQQLAFPQYTFKLQEKEGKKYIFDPIRKKYLVLTPEEWVRQHLICYLMEEKKCPKGLIGIEKGLRVNKLFKRTDIVVFNRQGTPRLLVECKAPTVRITQAVFDQIARYNLALQVPYLLVSNGLQHYCCEVNFEARQINYLNEIPMYAAL